MALLKEQFNSIEPFSLMPGQPAIAFIEEKISDVLRVEADETARASNVMLEILIQRTSLPFTIRNRTWGLKGTQCVKFRGLGSWVPIVMGFVFVVSVYDVVRVLAEGCVHFVKYLIHFSVICVHLFAWIPVLNV